MKLLKASNDLSCHARPEGIPLGNVFIGHPLIDSRLSAERVAEVGKQPSRL
jgi:hypothetical protein